jgi:hypothetical protein
MTNEFLSIGDIVAAAFSDDEYGIIVNIHQYRTFKYDVHWFKDACVSTYFYNDDDLKRVDNV